MTVRWLRRSVQLAALFLFGWLLYQSRWVTGGDVAPPTFLQLDPLVTLTSLLSRGRVVVTYILPGIVLLLLTVGFGRFFCGWICPLGTCIDISDTIFFRGRSGRLRRQTRPQWKYYILAVVLVAALFGTQIAWLVDPIPLLTRTGATVVYPLSLGAYNLFIEQARPLLTRFGLYLYPTEVHRFSLEIAVGVMFVVVLGLSFLARRMWCRSFCPLGGLLAFVGRFGIWKRYVTDECKDCGLCAPACKMGAIPEDQPIQTDIAECILCYDCINCPHPGAVGIGLPPEIPQDTRVATATSRRAFVGALGAGLAYGLLVRFGLRSEQVHPKLIRPPGANIRGDDGTLRRMTEEEFRELCVRCGNCMRACPARRQ